MHLSISLNDRGYRCWVRPHEHKGKHPAKLIQALLSCSWEQANIIAGGTTFIPDDFLSAVTNKLSPTIKRSNPPLILPKEFKSFENELPSSKPYVAYLERRGYAAKQIRYLTRDYDLHYCTSGSYKGRILFPVRFNAKWHSWAGRTIYPLHNPRYKVLSADLEKATTEGYAPAVGPITDYLLWYDQLKTSHGNTLVLVEGPFDATKVSILGYNEGIDSTCFFTMQPSLRQIDLLHEILPRYRKKVLLLDQGTLPTMIKISGELKSLGVEIKMLPASIKDPGELTSTQQLMEILK